MAEAACNICAKKASKETTLKRCGKCKAIWYCSRECQKADWKDHKESCSKLANEPFVGPSAPQKGLSVAIDNPFQQLENKTWLHNRPERDVYKLLIDTYRLRMADQRQFEGSAETNSLFGESADISGSFRRFLRKVTEEKRELLPSWWSPEKAEECEQLAETGVGWSSLYNNAVQKQDIIDHYENPLMPMQIRMFAEQIYGTGPGGQSGAVILPIMAMQEKQGVLDGHASC
ncbi:hypothetical protein BJX61DRAFT_344395 [Aspergillus egyptiacus]|nr:hypothetical protein BJX61DRAFT_344395 [Aspergillus egyptiacus]